MKSFLFRKLKVFVIVGQSIPYHILIETIRIDSDNFEKSKYLSKPLWYVENKNLNENIALNVTINVLIITALSVMAKEGYFDKPKLEGGFAELYGVALIFLILFYVFMEATENKLEIDRLLPFFKYSVLLNLALTCIVLGLFISPQIIPDVVTWKFVQVRLISVNIIIPIILFAIIFMISLVYFGSLIAGECKKMSNKENYTNYLLRNADKIPLWSMIIVSASLFVLVILVVATPSLVGAATVGVAVITVVAFIGNMWLSRQSHKETLEFTYITKQFEELYMPLYSVSPDFWKLDVKEIEKFSYLAPYELGKMVHINDEEISLIDKLIKCLKSPDGFTFHERNEVYEDVADAIKKDIESLKKDLNVHLKGK